MLTRKIFHSYAMLTSCCRVMAHRAVSQINSIMVPNVGFAFGKSKVLYIGAWISPVRV